MMKLPELVNIWQEIKRDHVSSHYVVFEDDSEQDYILIDNPNDTGCIKILEDRSYTPIKDMEFDTVAEIIFDKAKKENHLCIIETTYYNGDVTVRVINNSKKEKFTTVRMEILYKLK